MKATEAMQYLNMLHQLDPDAIAVLVNNRVPVEPTIACCTTVTCMDNGEGVPVTGMLGIINGMLEDGDEWVVAAFYTNSGVLVGFGVVAADLVAYDNDGVIGAEAEDDNE